MLSRVAVGGRSIRIGRTTNSNRNVVQTDTPIHSERAIDDDVKLAGNAARRPSQP
jgi:hypothetical protein